ncbi:MAG: hypothetical protein ABJH08_03315 [Balneola sp.]
MEKIMFRKENYFLVFSIIFFGVTVAFTAAPNEAVLPPTDCYKCQMGPQCYKLTRNDIGNGQTECDDLPGVYCNLYGYDCDGGPGGST